VRDDVRRGEVAGDGHEGAAGAGAAVHAGVGAGRRLVRADVLAREAEALVRALDGRLEVGEAVLAHGLVVRDVEVRPHLLGDCRVALVEARQHGRREGPALGPGLGADAVGAGAARVVRVALVGVLEHALDEGHGHLVDHGVEVLGDLVALGDEDLVAARLGVGELHLRGLGDHRRVRVRLRAVLVRAARAEVGAALLRQVHERRAARADRLARALEGAGVKGPALVPGVGRVARRHGVVVEDVAALAVHDRVLVLVEHVHPDALVGRALLDELALHEVLHRRRREGVAHEGVAVLLVAPVVLVDQVPLLLHHLGRARRREALDRADGARALDRVALGVAHGVALVDGLVGDVGLRAGAAAALLVDADGLGEVDRRDRRVDLLLVEVDLSMRHDVRLGLVEPNLRVGRRCAA